MIALIDGDVVAYRCAASCEPNKSGKNEREPLELAIARADELIYRILDTCQCQEYRVFLSGSENFRYSLYPEYKANRSKLPKPQWLEQVRAFLVKEWDASVCSGYEADDGIGIAAQGDFVICSNDKDLRTIPGEHYNFVNDTFEQVDDLTAKYNFWYLMLVGDPSDNIKGVEGIGKVKAPRILNSLDPDDWEENVRSLYNDDERFELNKKLFTVLREEPDDPTISEEQGEAITEVSGKEDLSPFGTVNS